MNEFIFYDSATKKFYDNTNTFYDDNENYKCALVDGKVLVHHYYNEFEESLLNPYKEDNIIIPLWSIGLKDINRKSIYADSSIVEFEYGTGGEYHKMTGYFSYNNQTLRYEIKDVNKREAIYLWTGYIEKEIKIIDTIQENKLGLIK